jgi:hypothetical protein
MTPLRRRQTQLELTFRKGDFVWVQDHEAGRLLARVRSSQTIQLVRGHVWLVSVRREKGWGPSEHRTVVGVPTVAELAELKTRGVLGPEQGALL